MTAQYQSTWPDVETCVICGHPQPGSRLARAALPQVEGQDHQAVWVCADFHVCRITIHACASGAHADEHEQQHAHLAAQVDSRRKIAAWELAQVHEMFLARMREWRGEHVISEPETDSPATDAT